MLRSAKAISRIRNLSMGLTGVVCLAYAALVPLTGKPDPISPWWPGAFGIATALIIAVSLFAADSRSAETALDELYRARDHLAQRIGYWSAILLYPVFGFLIAQDYISLTLAFPIMGTLTGAAYLIPHTLLTGAFE